MTSPKFPYPSKVYPPLNRCVYCPAKGTPSTQSLTTEHIIPFGFGGELIIPKASCEIHRKATCRVEDFILRKYLCALRSHLSLPSRRPGDRPSGYSLKLWRGGHSWKQKVKLADHPGLVRFVMFVEAPGRVAGRPREPQTWSIRLIDAEIFPDIRARMARLGAERFEDKVLVGGMMLARWIAKIGHCFAVAELGFDAFEEMYVTHVIGNQPVVGDEAADWNYWIGCYDRGRDIAAQELHELKLLRRGNDLSAIVHLLVPYCPRYAYEVIVGRLRPTEQIPAHLDEGLVFWNPAHYPMIAKPDLYVGGRR